MINLNLYLGKQNSLDVYKLVCYQFKIDIFKISFKSKIILKDYVFSKNIFLEFFIFYKMCN